MNARSITIAIFALLVVVAGWLIRTCSSQGDEVAQDGTLKEVTIMLDWTPNVNHVGIFVADSKGFFANEGLKVEIIEPGEVYPAAAVLSGKVQFGVDYQEYLTLFAEEQRGLLSIAALLQRNTSGFAVRARDGVQSVTDFARLRYGSFSAPFEEPTLRALLACYGASADAIEFVPVGTDLLTMLTQELVDVVWIFYGTQGFQAEELGIPIDYFPMNAHHDCIPDYYTPVVITSSEYAQAEPDIVRAFLAALDNAYDFIHRNSEQAAALLSASVPELNREELRRSVPWLMQYAYDQHNRWGAQRKEVWTTYADWMYRQGMLQTRPQETQILELFSNDYLPNP